MYSSPRAQCAISAARLLCVPLGKNRPASFPARSATVACKRKTVGSSPQTSSPTSAADMAASIGGVGRVTVSLRKSIMVCSCTSVNDSLGKPAGAALPVLMGIAASADQPDIVLFGGGFVIGALQHDIDTA